MDGITILSEKIFYSDLFPKWVFVLEMIGFFSFLALTVIGIVRDKAKIAVLSLIAVFFLLILEILTQSIKGKEIDYIEYKVTIDDSVPMTEFYQRYEILDQEGKIYTVKEKE